MAHSDACPTVALHPEDYVELAHSLVGKRLSALPSSVEVDRDEVESDAEEALVLTAPGYDPSRGVPATAYLWNRMSFAISDGFRRRDPMGRSARIDLGRVRAVRFVLARAGRMPTDDEIADQLGMSHERFTEVDKRSRDIRTLDSAVPELADVIRDEHPGPLACVIAAEEHAELDEAISTLPAGWQRVIRLSFFEGYRTIDIARRLGVTASAVSHVKRQALARLALILPPANPS